MNWPWDLIAELYHIDHPAARLTLHSAMFSDLWPGTYRFGMRRIRCQGQPLMLNRFVDWEAKP